MKTFILTIIAALPGFVLAQTIKSENIPFSDYTLIVQDFSKNRLTTTKYLRIALTEGCE